MRDEQLDRLIKRAEKTGIAITTPGVVTRKLAKHTEYEIYNNRRLNKSIVINPSMLKKVLDTDFF